MTTCCLVYTVPSPALPVSENYITESLLSGNGQLKRWAWADCPVNGLHFEDIGLLAQDTVLVYVYFGDTSITPFHSVEDIEAIAMSQLCSKVILFENATLHHFDMAVVAME